MIVIIILISVKFGIFGILIGQIISSFLAYIPNSYFSIKLIDYSVAEQLHDFIPTLLLAITMGVFMYATGLVLPLGEFGYVLVVGLGGAMFYILTNHLLQIPAHLLILQMIKEQYLKRNVKLKEFVA